MAKVCPQCNLSNPDDAVLCGCGCPLGEADSLEHSAASVLGAFAPAEGEVRAGAEESSTATVLPSHLPNPLGDPLRALRHVVSFLLISQIACLLVMLPSIPGILFDAAPVTFLCALALGMAAYLPSTLWLWSILPGRAVNAFYLRSFRNDPATWPIRKAAQAALGRKFRLSGIRDPRRRWLPVIRYIHAVFFAIRCCTPRFMNLEAGADWKARLWRSLGNARCALIDLSDLTPFVLEEIELCRRCLGLTRILFIGDSSHSHDAWRTRIGEALDWLDPTLYHAIRVAIWDASNVGRKAFAESVRAFAAELPPGVAGVKPEALSLVQSAGGPEGSPVGGSGGGVGEVVLGLLLGVVLFGVYNLMLLSVGIELKLARGLIALFLQLPAFAFAVIELCFTLRYIIDSGGWARVRALAIIPFTIFGAVGVLLLPDVEPVREAAARISCTNNLKQLSLSVHDYESANSVVPPAFAGPGWPTGQQQFPGGNALFYLLPFMEGTNVYNAAGGQSTAGKPWNQNQAVIKNFVCPSDPSKATNGWTYGITNYAFNVWVFNPQGAGSIVTSMPQGTSQTVMFAERYQWCAPSSGGHTDPVWSANPASTPNGQSNTILAAEATAPASWTKPDELVYDPQKPLPPLGGPFPGVFGAVFADGNVEFIPHDGKEFTLRALITRNGGDILGPDW